MPIAIDTETTLASVSSPVPALVSVAIHCSVHGTSLFHHTAVDWSRIARALTLEGAIFANAPFDIYVLLRAFPGLLPAVAYGYQHGKIYDVITREKFLDIATVGDVNRKYNLGALSEKYTVPGVDKEDPWRLRYAELLDVPLEAWPEDAKRYAERDASATYQVFEAQEAEARRLGLDVYCDQHRRARKHLALYSMTLRGFRTDPGAVEALDRRLRREITESYAELVRHRLVRVKKTKGSLQIGKSEKMARELAAQAGMTQTTESGKLSIAADAIEAAGLPEAHPLRAYARLTTLTAQRSKNLPVLRRPTVRSRYNELVSSGRTSSSAPNKKAVNECEPWEWTGTNLQNLPGYGGFRECLVPAPGQAFGVTDWNSAELVALAQVQLDWFGRSGLADVLRAGRNPHTEFACRNILRIPLDAYDPSNKVHKRSRTLAKAWNFGRPGGAGKRGFIALAKSTYGVDITSNEYDRIDAEYLRANPEMPSYFDRIRKMQDVEEGTITMVQPRSGRIRGQCFYTDACNTPFQGLTGDAAGEALWRMWSAFHLEQDSGIYSGPPVNTDGTVPDSGLTAFIHDEIVSTFPVSRASECLAVQDKIMVEAFGVWCPDVPIGVESVTAERYGKY